MSTADTSDWTSLQVQSDVDGLTAARVQVAVTRTDAVTAALSGSSASVGGDGGDVQETPPQR